MRLMSGCSMLAVGLILAISQTFAARRLNNLVTELIAVNTQAGREHVFRLPRDGWIRAYPEGPIDPNLSQITFYDDKKSPVACLNFYALHPQVSNGRHLWSADTVGVARDLFEQIYPGVFTLYFDGCGGDVPAGKYPSNIKQRDRLVFGSRLFDAMHAAFAKAAPRAFESFSWRDQVISLPLAAIDEDASHYRAIVESPDSSLKDQYLPALKLRRLLEGTNRYPFRMTRLTLNDAAVLTLPAELIVDYQMYAKSKCPDHWQWQQLMEIAF